MGSFDKALVGEIQRLRVAGDAQQAVFPPVLTARWTAGVLRDSRVWGLRRCKSKCAGVVEDKSREACIMAQGARSLVQYRSEKSRRSPSLPSNINLGAVRSKGRKGDSSAACVLFGAGRVFVAVSEENALSAHPIHRPTAVCPLANRVGTVTSRLSRRQLGQVR
jgi:hypothetical protein